METASAARPAGAVRGNIAGKAETARMRVGVVGFTLALLAAALLSKLGLPHALRWLLIFPFFVGVNGLYMGLFRT